MLRARGCKNASEEHNQCQKCKLLMDSPSLKGVLECLEIGVHENARLVYHGVGALVKIVRQKTGLVQALRLWKLNDA